MEIIRGHLGCPLSGGCPLFRGSAIGGSTVIYIHIFILTHCALHGNRDDTAKKKS